jgi:hypothetical protein
MQKQEGVFNKGDCVLVIDKESPAYGRYGFIGDRRQARDGYEFVQFISNQSSVATLSRGIHPDGLRHAKWDDKLRNDIQRVISEDRLYGQQLLDVHTMLCNMREFMPFGQSFHERRYVDAAVNGLTEDIAYQFLEPVEHVTHVLTNVRDDNRKKHNTSLDMYRPKQEESND